MTLIERLEAEAIIDPGESITLVMPDGEEIVGNTGVTSCRRNPDGPEAAARIRELEATQRAIVAKLDECGPHITSLTTFALAHGYSYDGPNYRAELDAARALLSDGGEGEA